MYRIVWRIIHNGVTGNGQYMFNLDEVKEIVISLNKKYPDMEHLYECKIANTARYEL